MKENKFWVTTKLSFCLWRHLCRFHGPQIHCLWFCFFCNIMALQISILNTGKRTDWVRNHKWLHHEHRLDFFWNIWCIQDVCKNTVLFYKYDRITKKYIFFIHSCKANPIFFKIPSQTMTICTQLKELNLQISLLWCKNQGFEHFYQNNEDIKPVSTGTEQFLFYAAINNYAECVSEFVLWLFEYQLLLLSDVHKK